MNLKSIIYLIPRTSLWQKLKTTVDHRFLWLMWMLYGTSTDKVKCWPEGQTTRVLIMKSGFKPGCLMAPLLKKCI